MTQEQKDLLLKDLCARLPYKVKIQDTYYKSLEPAPIWLLDLDAQSIRLFADEGYQSIEYIKPYLFPLSSMTREQEREWQSLMVCDIYGIFYHTIESFDYLYKNHFDIYELIPKGLANDATGLNIY